MSETFVIGGFETKTGTTQKGKAWTLWILKSATGEKIGGTFDAAVGNSFPSFVGSPAEVDRDQDEKGYTIKAIRPSAGGHTQAPVAAQTPSSTSTGQGQYWKPRDPKESRSIIRQTALKAACHVAAGMSADLGAADITGLASQFEVWLTRPLPEEVSVGGQDSDIPFMPTIDAVI